MVLHSQYHYIWSFFPVFPVDCVIVIRNHVTSAGSVLHIYAITAVDFTQCGIASMLLRGVEHLSAGGVTPYFRVKIALSSVLCVYLLHSSTSRNYRPPSLFLWLLHESWSMCYFNVLTQLRIDISWIEKQFVLFQQKSAEKFTLPQRL